MVPRRYSLTTTAETLQAGTSIRYHHRSGSSLATVTERTDDHIVFAGDDCNGHFTHDQVNYLLTADRLQVVLDDCLHVPEEALSWV
jgi:hypothetical protein